jgi:predicted Zn-dependent protease with MMP-like domain
MEMTDEEFIRVIKAAIKQLPSEFKDQLDNVDIVLEDWPSAIDLEGNPDTPPISLFGLYHGVPKTERYSYSALPDKITIFKQPILFAARSPQEAEEIIKDTVLHELGHHFGLSDEELEKIKF